MILHSLSITGAGAAVPLSSIVLTAKLVKIQIPSGNSADVLIGGAEVSSSVGYPIVKGTSLTLEPIAELQEFYDLSQIKVYVANNDLVKVIYGG